MRAPALRLAFALALALAAGLARPDAPLTAQTLVGRVLDEYTNAPVVGAQVWLVDPDGDRRREIESDSLGRYVLRPPRAGAYRIVASRLGYEAGRTPLLDLSHEGSREVDLVLTPLPIGLPGVEATVSAEEALERQLRPFGVTPGQIPEVRLVTADEIAEVAGAMDFGHVLQRQNIPGVTVVREQDEAVGAAPHVCVKMGEGWRSGCTILVVDGVVTPQNTRTQRSVLVPPEAIEAIVVLKPSEATLVYGGIGGNGAVLIFTKGSGWRR